MKIAIYPGSFDPITNGHLDILKSGSEIFDKVIIAVSYNINKQGFLSVDERVELIKKSVAHFKNVEVDAFEGLTVEYAKKKGADILLRGLRTSFDFEYELQMALLNRNLKSQCETIFMMPTLKNSFVASSLVKEVAKLKGDFEQYVPEPVAKAVKAKLGI